MTTALEIGGAFLFMATLLIVVLFLAALHLGRLVTRDGEQREVEVAPEPRMVFTTSRWPQLNPATLQSNGRRDRRGNEKIGGYPA